MRTNRQPATPGDKPSLKIFKGMFLENSRAIQKRMKSAGLTEVPPPEPDEQAVRDAEARREFLETVGVHSLSSPAPEGSTGLGAHGLVDFVNSRLGSMRPRWVPEPEPVAKTAGGRAVKGTGLSKREQESVVKAEIVRLRQRLKNLEEGLALSQGINP